MEPTIPTGQTSEAAQAYFEYLYTVYYSNIPTDRATNLLWSSPLAIALWSISLIVIFFLFAFFFFRAHRSQDELYGATSFAGSLLERNGRVSIFTWVIIIAMFVLAGYYIVFHILQGYLY